MKKPLFNHNGITIAELKEFVKNLPEIDIYGEPYELWIDNGNGTSSVAKEIWPLNAGDIIIGSDQS